MQKQFNFDSVQKPIIENGRAVQNVELNGVKPNFPLIQTATDLWPGQLYNMPKLAIMNFDSEGTQYSFYMNVEINASHKSKEVFQPFDRPILPQCPIDAVTYQQKLRINCKGVLNTSNLQSMYVLTRIVDAVGEREKVDVYSDGNKKLFLKSTIILEVSLRTAYSPAAYIPTDFSDRIWDKSVKYVHVPVESIRPRLKVTEGMKY